MKRIVIGLIAAGLLACFASESDAGIFRRAGKAAKNAVCRVRGCR
jgi:hypothetical protein